jgi:hypothetical protein
MHFVAGALKMNGMGESGAAWMAREAESGPRNTPPSGSIRLRKHDRSFGKRVDLVG